jgi:UDPglucose 6-dehydrogenase
MIKYASNAFLATKISYINAIANICDAVGADVKEVALGMGYDGRIGFEFLKPGPGFGGSCFPKDCKALIRSAELAGYDFDLLRGVLEVNERQHHTIARKVERVVGGSLEDTTIAAWGIAFKPNTDDVRESPAIAVLRLLAERGARISAYDPAAHENGYTMVPGMERAPGALEAAQGADCVVLLTEWNEFRWVDFTRLREIMRTPAIVDARNFLEAHTLRQLGFDYEGVGR